MLISFFSLQKSIIVLKKNWFFSIIKFGLGRRYLAMPQAIMQRAAHHEVLV